MKQTVEIVQALNMISESIDSLTRLFSYVIIGYVLLAIIIGFRR